jgi:ABC-type multidrug transport system fused ATPase/permease subunit
MFHQSIGPTSILHDKTRMVVLNSHLHLLKFFDQVWVMESSPAGGQIVAKGRYEEIEAKFPALLQQDRLATQVEGEGEQNAPTSGRALNEIKEEASDEVSIVTTRNGGPSRAKTALYLPRMIDDGTASIVVPQPNRRGSTSFYLPTSPDGSMDVGAVWEHRQVPQSGDDVLKSQLKAHRKHQEREESVSVYHMASRQNALSPSHGALSPIPIFSTYHDVGDGDEATALVGSADTAPVGHLQQASRSFYHLTRESALKKDSPSPQLDQHAAYRPSALQWPAHGPLTKKDSEAREGSPLHSAQSQTDSPLRVVRAMQLAHLGGGASGTPRQDTPADSPRAGVDAKLRRTSFSVAAPPPETLEPESNPTTVAVLAPTSVAASPAPSLMAREDRASGSVGFQMWRYYFDLIALAKVPEMMDVDEETIPKVPGKGAKAVIASFTNQGGMLQASFTNQGNNNLQAPQKGGVVVSATPTPTETSTPEEVDSSDLPVAVIQDPETTRVVSTTYAGVAILVAVVAYFILCQVVRVGCDLLLTFWGSEQASATTARAEGRDPNEHSLLFWALLCLAATFIAIILVGLRAWIFVRLALRTSHALHRILFRRLLLAPITTFYDVQPLGRILNRMSKDMDQCDSFLPDLMAQFFQHGFNLVGGLVLSVVSTPYFLAVLAPICFAFYHLQAYFRVCSRELKRIEGITRSPIFSTFGETLLGLPTIRAYRCEEAFILKQRAAIRANNKIYQAFYLSSRWLSLRLDLISNFLVLGVGLFGIFLRGGLDPALIGLAMLYTLQFLGLLQWAVRVSVDTENSMTSVERLSHYHNLPSEAAYIVPSSQSAPFGWPTRGAIVFSNLKLRYRPELPLVLKGVSAKIEPREKIGICGRTGSGKSSLMVSLFRIVESAPGSILIDGVDISLIGLRELRSSISIIPQDPVMFSGTIRSNLDPFHERTDAQLWQILEQVSMKAYVSSLQMGLESHVNEYGDNFSHGQKQLFCIARALLRQSRIIVLDEATAAVDNETDALIQKTIKESFADCTVLTM